MSTISGTIVSDADDTSCVTPCIVVCIRGMMFSPTVTTLSTKLLISVSKSALSSASPVTRLAHALFMDAVEP